MESDPTRFPAAPLQPAGPASEALLARDVADLRAAIRYVRDLPYGRPDPPYDQIAVVSDERGTCSTKHALLATVADELDVEGVKLTLGIYEMTEANTPGVGPVLTAHGLDAIPEAHCYLRYDDDRFDFTQTDDDGEPISTLRDEEAIDPGDIGAYKRAFHRAALERWCDSLDRELSPEEAWEIREACIAALSGEA